MHKLHLNHTQTQTRTLTYTHKEFLPNYVKNIYSHCVEAVVSMKATMSSGQAAQHFFMTCYFDPQRSMTKYGIQ
jgi:hypothetical protein